MSCGHLCTRACSCLSHCMHEQLLALCGHMSRISAGILQQSVVLNCAAIFTACHANLLGGECKVRTAGRHETQAVAGALGGQCLTHDQGTPLRLPMSLQMASGRATPGRGSLNKPRSADLAS